MRQDYKKRGTEAVVWSVASSLLSRGAGIIFTPIFTRILTPSEFGVYSLYTGVMGIFTVLCTLEISGSTIYKGFAMHEGEKSDTFTTAAVGVETAMTVISLLIFALFRGKIRSLSGLDGSLPAILILQIFFTAVSGIYVARERYLGNYRSVLIINAVNGLLSPPLALILIHLGLRERGRIFAQLTVSFAVMLYAASKILKRSKRLYSGNEWKYIFRLLLPMLPHYLSASLIAQGDKLIVAKGLGEGAVGRYSAAFSVGHLPSLITGGVSLALTPHLMKLMKNGKGKDAERIAKTSIRVTALFILGFLSLLPEIFRFFASPDYYDAIPVAYFIAEGVLLSFSTQLTNTALIYHRGSGIVTVNTVIAAILFIPLTYLLSSRIGLVGAAVASFTAYAIILALSYRSATRLFKSKTVNVNNYLPIYIVSVLGAILVFVLRPSLFARILLFLAISLALCLEIFKALKEAPILFVEKKERG